MHKPHSTLRAYHLSRARKYRAKYARARSRYAFQDARKWALLVKDAQRKADQCPAEWVGETYNGDA